MKEIIHEYGAGILAAIATTLILGLFAGLVFSPTGVVAKNVRTFARGYAGETDVDGEETLTYIDHSRGNLPEPVAKRSVFSGEEYDVEDVFNIPDGYRLRVSRVTLLDDLLDYETARGRGNMAIGAYYDSGSDVTGQVCSDRGMRLRFPDKGYYALRATIESGHGETLSGLYLISVRERV